MPTRRPWLCVAALLWLAAPSAVGWAQTSGSFETQDRPAQAKPAQEAEPESEKSLYILKDVEKPEPQEPKLDLGKVGEDGKLTIERMRGPDAAIADEEGKPRGGAGVRLRIPLGDQEKP